MLQPHQTVSLVGPFSAPAEAMVAITAQMAVDHFHPTELDSRRARVVTVLAIAEQYWADVGAADKVIARLLLEGTTSRAYRCVLELSTRCDDRELYPFAGELSVLVADPGATVPRAEHTRTFEHEGHRFTRTEHAWAYAAALMAEHEGIDLDAAAGLPRVEQHRFDVRDEGVRPAVARARRAIADAADCSLQRVGPRWELRLQMTDGSRRLLVLDDADRDELDLPR